MSLVLEPLQHRRLTMSDVALLARVQRPVVSTWRSRSAGTDHPFPSSVASRDGQELFDCEDAVVWLERTGRGNNPDPRGDAIAFTLRTADVIRNAVSYAGLSALLCLQAMAGELPADPEDVLDLADAHDPDDVMLYRELEALGDDLDSMSRYASLLADAAYDKADPFEQLVQQRAQAQGGPRSNLSLELRSLVAGVAWAVADQAGFADPTFVVSSAEEVELVLAIARQAERRGAVLAAVRAAQGDELRLARRRLRVHDITHVDLRGGVADELASLEDAVLLIAATGVGREADDAALEFVSDLSLSLGPRHRTVVVGAASCLTDALRKPHGPAGRPPAGGVQPSRGTLVRRDVIRTGLLRAVVRLPQGGLLNRTRSRAALWCLGPSSAHVGRVAHTVCCDIASALTEGLCDELITDVVAGMAGLPSGRGHTLQHGRFIPTSQLQLADGDLVVPGTRPASTLQSAEVVQRLSRLGERVAQPLPGLEGVVVSAVERTGTPRLVTLNEAIRSRTLRWLPGTRVDAADLAGGSLTVIATVDHVSTPVLTMDRMVHAARYEGSQLTLPGDVVVETAPRPRAVVDHRGGLLVTAPARVLRCFDPGAFTPEALAADINALPNKAKQWKAWPLRVIPASQQPALHAALTDIASHRREIQARLRALEELSSTLVTGVSSRTLEFNARAMSDPAP